MTSLRLHRYNPLPHVRCRLFCFPHGGAGVGAYREWPGNLPPGVEVCTVEYPGRDSLISEPPITELSLLVEGIVAAISPCLYEPYVLFGHSVGALVAFELARALSKHRQTPKLLVVSGHQAPHLSSQREPIHDLPDDEFLEEIKSFDPLESALVHSEELAELLLPALRADIKLHEDFKLKQLPKLTIPLAICGGLDDPEVSREELAGWARHTTEGHLLQLFPGGHFYLRESRAELLQMISELLKPLIVDHRS